MKEQLEKLIEDLDKARSLGVIFTYGQVQARLRKILGESTENGIDLPGV